MSERQLPGTPHELPLDRGEIDALLTRVRDGERVDLLEALLGAIAWPQFGAADGTALTPLEQAELRAYYREKFSDIGPLFLAELLSTEFMTEQRARGDITFSDRLIALGRTDPELWQEISRFFRRKEMVTAMLVQAHAPAASEPDAAAPATG